MDCAIFWESYRLVAALPAREADQQQVASLTGLPWSTHIPLGANQYESLQEQIDTLALL